MSRFQALTNAVLDDELEMLRERLRLEPSQKADLLREITALAAWVVRQAEQGRSIEARRGEEVEPLMHPAIQRLRAESQKPVGKPLALSDAEAVRLAAVLDRGFDPPPALRKALASLASPKRRPPRLRWKKPAA
jgi:hypothetical protein